MKRYEKDYYPVIKKWFEDKCKCSKVEVNSIIGKSQLLSADVIGWKSGDLNYAYACELKPYPLPVGSQGYGAIGQALMLKHYAKNAKVYVACVATERKELVDGPVVYWKIVMNRRSTKSLLDDLHIPFPDDSTFSDYRDASEIVFQRLFSSTGLGFLIVHEKNSKEDINSSYEILEVINPNG